MCVKIVWIGEDTTTEEEEGGGVVQGEKGASRDLCESRGSHPQPETSEPPYRALHAGSPPPSRGHQGSVYSGLNGGIKALRVQWVE